MTMGTGRGAGISLSPVARTGDALLWENNRHPLAVGSLAVFVGCSRQICHQVLWRKKQESIYWYYLKGNGWANQDGWIPEYRILGVVKQINQKKVKSLSLFLFWLRGVFEVILFAFSRSSLLQVWTRLRKQLGFSPFLFPSSVSLPGGK